MKNIYKILLVAFIAFFVMSFFAVSATEAEEGCEAHSGSCVLSSEPCPSGDETDEYVCADADDKCCLGTVVNPEAALPETKSTPPPTVSLENPLTVEANPSTIIGLIIKAILGVVGGLALVMSVYGGFQWLTAAGNKEKIDSGSKTMLWAIVGLILTLSSYLLVDTFLNFMQGNR